METAALRHTKPMCSKALHAVTTPGPRLAYLAYVCLFRPSAREERDDKARESSMYYYTLPDAFGRTQMAVGALMLFGVLRAGAVLRTDRESQAGLRVTIGSANRIR